MYAFYRPDFLRLSMFVGEVQKIISVKLKSTWQRINTVAFYLRNISTPLVGVVFNHIDQIQKPFLQKLIWRQICSAMASLVPQSTFQINNVSQQRCPCICFDKVTIIAIYIGFVTVTFQTAIITKRTKGF